MAAITLPASVSAADSETSTAYLTWQANNPSATGHVSLTYPRVLDNDQTYKVEVTLTLESSAWGDSAEFKTIQWLLDTGNRTQVLGNSFVDKTVAKHTDLSVASFWSLSSQSSAKNGTLQMNAEVVLHDSNQTSETRTPSGFQVTPVIQILLRIKCQISLKLSPSTVISGDPLNVSGKVDPALAGATVNITYVKPTGEAVFRMANTDSTGNFVDTYSPNADGTWAVKASLIGTDGNGAATTEMTVFKVEPKFPWIVIFTAVGVLAALFGPMIALAILGKRKTALHPIIPQKPR